MLDFLFTRSRGAGLHGAGLREILDRSGVGRQPVATGKLESQNQRAGSYNCYQASSVNRVKLGALDAHE